MKILRVLMVLMAAALFLTACGGNKPAASNTPAQGANAEAASAAGANSAAAPGVSSRSQMTARVGIGSTNALIYLPISVARAQKLFDKEDLTIEHPNFSGGAQIAQALALEQLDFALFSYNHIVKWQTQGFDLVAVAMIAELPGSALVVDARYKDTIKSIADLKGKKVGVTSPGSGSHDGLNSMLAAVGGVPDVEVIGVGFDLEKAFKDGKVVAGVTYEPYVSILTETKGGVLLDDPRSDLRTLKGVKALYDHERYPMTTLVTSRKLVEKNPDLVQRMVNAIVAANGWIASRSPEEVASLVPDSDKGDPRFYVAALKAAKNIISARGSMDEATVETVVKDLRSAKVLPATATIDVKSVFDNRFVQSAKLAAR